MNKHPRISIGIPAYNEEANIKQLLLNILNQHEISFVLDAVYVISDGNEDRTASEVRSVNDNRVQLHMNESRMGQVYAQNTIFTLANSDIVVILEADTNPQDENYLARLVDPIIADSNVGLVQGNTVPLPAHTFLGRSVQEQIEAYCAVSSKDCDARTRIISGRGGRAFARYVYKKMVWPDAVPEDAYAFLWCHTSSIPTVFQESAICHFRCSETFSDFLKERTKIAAGKKALEDYFSADEIRRVFSMSHRMRMQMFAEFFLRHPYYAVYYLLMSVVLAFSQKNKRFSDLWEMTISTKKL